MVHQFQDGLRAHARAVRRGPDGQRCAATCSSTSFHDPDPIELIELLGVENSMWGSDFPHPEGLRDPLAFSEEIDVAPARRPEARDGRQPRASARRGVAATTREVHMVEGHPRDPGRAVLGGAAAAVGRAAQLPLHRCLVQLDEHDRGRPHGEDPPRHAERRRAGSCRRRWPSRVRRWAVAPTSRRCRTRSSTRSRCSTTPAT